MVRRLFRESAAEVAPPREGREEPPPVARPVGTSARHRPTWRTVAIGTRRMRAMLTGRLPPTVLLGPLSPRREVAFTGVDLSPLHDRAREVGATVNDALLAAVTGAVEAGLAAAGKDVPRPLPASVPVALPDRRGSGNAVGVMMVPLPTHEPDPVRRLAVISSWTRSHRAEARGQGTLELTRTRWGSYLFARLARRQRFVALFVTNVRGPSTMLTVAGAPLLRAWPVAQIQGNVRLGVAAMSYAGRLSCTVHAGDPSVPARVVASALGGELDRLAGFPRHLP